MPQLDVTWPQLFTMSSEIASDDDIKECIVRDYADFYRWVKDNGHSEYNVYDWNHGDLKLDNGGDYIVIRVYYPDMFELNVEMDDSFRILSFSLERF